jgi:hypothetical protein
MSFPVIRDMVADNQYRPPQGFPHWLYRHGQRATHLATRRQIALYPKCKFIPWYHPPKQVLMTSLAVFGSSPDLPD